MSFFLSWKSHWRKTAEKSGVKFGFRHDAFWGSRVRILFGAPSISLVLKGGNPRASRGACSASSTHLFIVSPEACKRSHRLSVKN